MKKLSVFLFVAFSIMIKAQSPDSFNFQAVVRDAGGNVLVNTPVQADIKIWQTSPGTTLVLDENYNVTTNGFGLINLMVGSVNTVQMAAIDWSAGPYYIEVIIDGTSVSTTQLLSVPFALHAKTADAITESDPFFTGSPANGITAGDITSWNNKLDTEVDGSVTNEIQILTISNDTVYLSDGGFVKLPAGFSGNYSDLTGTPVNVSAFTNDAGYLNAEVDGSVTNEIQILSISNDTIFLSDGGFVKIPASNWLLSGNAGTIDGINFIGTSDNVPLNFMVNNQKAGRIDQTGVTAFGYQAANSNMGASNTAFGYRALFNNMGSGDNTAIGNQALESNTGLGINTAVGSHALKSNTTGEWNTAIGGNALVNNTTGTMNTAIGGSALGSNISGGGNIALGGGSLMNFQNGIHNTSAGFQCMLYTTSGSHNTAMGYQAGANCISGSNNVFIGSKAGFNETGSNKLYIANSEVNPPLIYGDFLTGNVGIGTINPTTKLDVNGVITASGGNSTIWNTAYGWGNHATAGYLTSFSEQDTMIWKKNAGNIYYNMGNVGIGISTVSEKLEVNGNIKSSGIVYSPTFGAILSTVSGNSLSLKAGRAGGGIGADIQFTGGSLNGGNLYLEAGGANHFAKGGDVIIRAGDAFDTGSQGGSVFLKTGGYNNTGAPGFIAFHTGANYPANIGNPFERMRIDGNGNVGIGTTVPNAKLDLGTGYGSSGEKFLLYNDNTSGPLAGTKTGFYLDRFSLQNNVTFVFPTAPAFPGSYIIARKNTAGTTLEPLMTILGESGNVGIGTATPTEQLEVNGNVKVSGSIYAPGTVVQTVVRTSEVTSSLNVTTFTEANTDYRISFTPKFNNSIILVEYTFPANTAMQSNTVFHMQLVRDIGGTETLVGVGPVNGTRNRVSYSGRPGNGYDGNDQMTIHMVAKDEGLTAGTTYTYGFKYRRETGGSGTCYFNYSNSDGTVVGFSGVMTMKITEIAQ